MTVGIFWALQGYGLWVRQRLAGRLWAGTHSAVIRCIRRHPIALTMYIGCLPNSSLKELVTSGTRANPRVYMDIPMVAMMFVERKSWVIEANPSAYAPDEEAVDTWSDMLVVEEAKKDRPVMSEKNEAVSVIAHFRAYVKFAGSRGSPSSKSTCRRYGQNRTFSREPA